MEKSTGNEFTQTKYRIEVYDSKSQWSQHEVEAPNVSEARRIARNLHIVKCSVTDADYKSSEKLPQIFTDIIK